MTDIQANVNHKEKPHILVVDDDDRLRDLIRRYLSENGFMVITAQDAADARQKLTAFAVDLIILDVMMPGEDGISLMRSLRQETTTPILMLTARSESENRIIGLEAGADDYLAKPFEPRELVLRLEAILRRVPKTDPISRDIRLGRWQLDLERDALIGKEGERENLSAVEASLLRVLATSPGLIFSREDLCERSPIPLNVRSIDVQVVRLRRKIEDNPRRPRYLQTVRGEGYVLRPD